jgi:cobalamin biosynthesis protein CobW
MILLNKTDLMSGGERDGVRGDIAGHLPRAVKIIETAHGRVDPALLLGFNAAAEADLAARPSHHESEDDHDHDDFESIALPVGAATSAEALAERVGRAAEAEGVLRIKGFVPVENRPMRLVVQGVGRRINHHYDRPWRPGEARDGRLVVIGLKGFDRAAVEAALA